MSTSSTNLSYAEFLRRAKESVSEVEPSEAREQAA